MSDLTQLLIAIGVVLNAAVAIVGAVQSIRNGQKSARIEQVQATQGKDMAELAVNTNSIRDALVASTAKASLAEGTAVGLEQGRSERTEQAPIKVDIVKVPGDILKPKE